MLPINKVKEIVIRYETLEKTLSQSDIDKNTYVKNSKEYSSIGDIIVDVKSYIKMIEDKEGSEKILQDKSADKELKEMAEIELLEIKEKILDLETKIKIFMLPKDEADEKNAIIEIRAGTGGQEAAIFAGDLFSMYQKVATNNGWKTEIISISEGDAGGYKEIVFSVTGKNVFSKLKFESGVHRVQRVPKTETQGRVHTLAATVAVLPEAEEVDINIEDKDLRIDVFRSSGPGGQSVNTTDSAVRITHLPSGIVVSQQDEKSQHKNKAKALKILRSRILDNEIQKKNKQRSLDRKSQVGSGDRSERIRTYNFPQGRVSDHRINLTLYNLAEVLEGNLDDLINPLMTDEETNKLAELGNE